MKNELKVMVGALALVSLQAHAIVVGNLVQNSGFETGDFTGWAQSGNTGATFVGTGSYAHSGTYGAALGPVGSDGYLSQNLSTVIGDVYDITFWHFGYNGTTNDFTATFGSTVLLSYLNDTAQPSTYTEYSYAVTATSASTVLQFEFRNDPSYQGLDDVSVMDAGANTAPDAGPGLALTAITLLGVCFGCQKMRQQFAV